MWYDIYDALLMEEHTLSVKKQKYFPLDFPVPSLNGSVLEIDNLVILLFW